MSWNFKRKCTFAKAPCWMGSIIINGTTVLLLCLDRFFNFLILYTIGMTPRTLICSRLQVRKTPTLLGPIERANLNQFPKFCVFYLFIIPDDEQSLEIQWFCVLYTIVRTLYIVLILTYNEQTAVRRTSILLSLLLEGRRNGFSWLYYRYYR
jgi:uncharacterized MAPEG superfamily protein